MVCVETLCELITSSSCGMSSMLGVEKSASSGWRVCMVSASPTLKTAVNVRRVTRLLETFDVAERTSEEWSRAWPHTLTILIDKVSKVE